MKKKDKTPFALKVIRWVYPKAERIAPHAAHRYFTKLFFTPFRYEAPEKEKKAETFAVKFSLEAAGKRIQCYSWGEGKPVLVVHGWAGRATQFRRFVKPLNAAGFKVVGFDGPAHGNSEGKTTTITEFEEVMHKMLAAIGKPVAVIAHSFGGGAVLYSVMNGLPVTRLINIASPSIGDEIINTYIGALRGSPDTGTFFKEYIKKTYGKSFDEFTSSYFIRHLPAPVDLLLVHDEGDKEVSIRQAEQIVTLYPSARLLKTKGLGHTRILKDDHVIRSCVTFIKNGTSTE